MNIRSTVSEAFICTGVILSEEGIDYAFLFYETATSTKYIVILDIANSNMLHKACHSDGLVFKCLQNLKVELVISEDCKLFHMFVQNQIYLWRLQIATSKIKISQFYNFCPAKISCCLLSHF